MRRKKPLRSRTRLRRASKGLSARLREYSRLRLAFLRAHLFCAICGEMSGEVHHTRGRRGQRLNDFAACIAVCRRCHQKIHDHPGWARSQGYLVK